VIDTTAIRRDLGWSELVPLGEGLRVTAAWEREHPAEQDWLGDYAAEDAALARDVAAEHDLG
jgi:dTDP-D-glucose 4,6-dehydratase